MPELPEVQVVCNKLKPLLINKVVVGVWSDSKRHLNTSIKNYQKRLIGFKIKSVYRVSKNIVINFSNQENLLIHLKMTGQLLYVAKKKIKNFNNPGLILPNKHTHFSINFKNGDVLYFNDVRKFGYAKLFNNKELKEDFLRLGYGIDPTSNDFTLEYFKEILREDRRSLKRILMDQSVLAGIGNIYADESMFLSRLHPHRQGLSLNLSEVKNLRGNIIKILDNSIKKGGSTISDFVSPDGKVGDYKQSHKIYGREGEPCLKCKTEVTAIKIGGRTTTFCTNCQPEF